MNSDPITYESNGQWCAWGVVLGRVVVAISHSKDQAVKDWHAKSKQETANAIGK